MISPLKNHSYPSLEVGNSTILEKLANQPSKELGGGLDFQGDGTHVLEGYEESQQL